MAVEEEGLESKEWDLLYLIFDSNIHMDSYCLSMLGIAETCMHS